ncbi:hypothetical protein E4U40_006541 [Claviceps sp. LM458 group G5]|nr:hypothetical protein E4U40_006541 [Claviceps sp. LM458 group G5]
MVIYILTNGYITVGAYANTFSVGPDAGGPEIVMDWITSDSLDESEVAPSGADDASGLGELQLSELVRIASIVGTKDATLLSSSESRSFVTRLEKWFRPVSGSSLKILA